MHLPRPGYLARKLLGVAATLFAVLTFNFLLFRILPGDPVRLLARAGNLSPEAIERLRQSFGLDQPLPAQYLIYLRNLATGDLGTSLTYRRPVAAILAERMENTLILLAAATVIVVAFGILFGVYAAARRGTRVDSGTVVTSLVFWSLPTFWVGLIFVFILGVYLRVLPISGMTTPGAHYGTPIEAIVDVSRHLVLPTLTLALVDVGQFILITRSSLIDVLTEDFILTAKAKGLSRRRVIWRHGVPNAMLPIVTATALYVSLIVGGTIQVETVFSYPGMGRLMYDAVLRRDYPVLEASFLLFAVTVIFANLASDLLYRYLDPRVRDA
jgi:peptide/nickel transport system permease protein